MDEETADRAKNAAKSQGISLSKWIARLVRLKTAQEWPESVRSLAGAWNDLPSADELRDELGEDVPREPL